MGTWMQSVAQGWLVYTLAHWPLLLGLASFCRQVPVFFVSPFGGTISDRVDRRRMLIVTQSLSMLFLLPAAFSLMLLGGSTNTIFHLLSEDQARPHRRTLCNGFHGNDAVGRVDSRRARRGGRGIRFSDVRLRRTGFRCAAQRLTSNKA
jgi:hypothetical protein